MFGRFCETVEMSKAAWGYRYGGMLVTCGLAYADATRVRRCVSCVHQMTDAAICTSFRARRVSHVVVLRPDSGDIVQ